MAAKKRKVEPHADGIKVLVRNRKAFHNYQIHERIEAGLVLVGSEVKSVRDSRASLTEGYAEIRDNQAWLHGIQINEYPWANRMNHIPTRVRKLLLHKREIYKLGIKTQQRGFTLVPLALYLKNGKVKVELGLGSGKREYEKRQSKREADDKREIARVTKRNG